MRKLPVGVAIIGFFALLAGIANLVTGARIAGWVVFGPGDFGSGTLFWGIVTIAVGLLYLAAATALWAMQTWAWLFTMLLAVFALLDAVFVTIATGSLSYGFAASIIPIVVLWYINTDGIKRAFKIDEAQPTM